MRHLAGLLIALAIIIVPSFLFGYWYTHSHEIFVESLEEIRRSPAAKRVLGDDISASLWVHLRVSGRHDSGDARYKVSGSRGAAEARVSAYQEGDEWNFRWIWMKLPSGEYMTVLDDRDLGGS